MKAYVLTLKHYPWLLPAVEDALRQLPASGEDVSKVLETVRGDGGRPLTDGVEFCNDKGFDTPTTGTDLLRLRKCEPAFKRPFRSSVNALPIQRMYNCVSHSLPRFLLQPNM